MPRALWSGSLSFGLVNVPVQLFSNVRDLDYHFHQLHQKDKARIEQRRYCSEENVEVVWEEIAHSYELDSGKEVVVSDEELSSVEPRKTRTIDVEAFVDLAEVDPIYFDHPYYLVPAGESEGTLRAYQLLVEAMGNHDRAALGRFVMRTKEYLVAVRVLNGVLALTTMLFHDEVRPTKPIPTGGKEPAKGLVDEALAIIGELSADWDPESYTDCYRERLRKVIDRKRKGQTIEAPEVERPPKRVPDLMEALERTLQNVRAGEDARAEPDASDRTTNGRKELARLGRDELYKRAQREKIPGRTKMSKEQLLDALTAG